MLSSTIFMSRSWQPRADFMELEREWQWPEMDPWKVIIDDDPESGNTTLNNVSGISPMMTAGDSEEPEYKTNTKGSPATRHRLKTWDLSDPALTLENFLTPTEWRNQTLVPGPDLVNLLRTLRPIDHAFFITLFVNQSPRQMEVAREESQGNSPKIPMTPIRDRPGCGSWIPDFVEFQNRILNKSLPSRYSIHTCPMISHTSNHDSTQTVQQPQQRQLQPCGDLFSQMLAMTSAFAWSVTESRGFFSNKDQLQGLQESFDQSLLQHWIAPPKADSTARINTEDMTSRDLDRLFRLHDPLFSYYINNNSHDNPLEDNEFNNKGENIEDE
ncbi:hypothetical protein BGX26_001845 [Mortierella sp. AD094]|nr:hypothetical protein BGX26_001845 [Mortierella sp. AD094]